jgi:hypothetical protein
MSKRNKQDVMAIFPSREIFLCFVAAVRVFAYVWYSRATEWFGFRLTLRAVSSRLVHWIEGAHTGGAP